MARAGPGPASAARISLQPGFGTCERGLRRQCSPSRRPRRLERFLWKRSLYAGKNGRRACCLGVAWAGAAVSEAGGPQNAHDRVLGSRVLSSRSAGRGRVSGRQRSRSTNQWPARSFQPYVSAWRQAKYRNAAPIPSPLRQGTRLARIMPSCSRLARPCRLLASIFPCPPRSSCRPLTPRNSNARSSVCFSGTDRLCHLLATSARNVGYHPELVTWSGDTLGNA